MPIYEWKNEKTGKVVETDKHDEPPDLPGKWKRVYSLSIGAVSGAGESGGGYVTTRDK